MQPGDRVNDRRQARPLSSHVNDPDVLNPAVGGAGKQRREDSRIFA